METLDQLNIESDPEIMKCFGKDEIVMFSEKINKVNRHGYKQERELVLTSKSLYVFKKK